MKNLLLIVLLSLYSFFISAQNSEWLCFYETYGFTCIAEDQNNIWTGSRSGITSVTKSTGQVSWFNEQNIPVTERSITCMTVDSQGSKWFISDSGYLYKLEAENWSTYDTLRYYLDGKYAGDIVSGNNNDLWIIGYDCLIKFDGIQWNKYTTANSGLPSNYLDEIYFIDGILWIGKDNTLTSFDGSNWNTYISPNVAYGISDIKKDTQGNLWILHNTALEKFDGTSFILYNNANTNLPLVLMNSLAIDQAGILWIGCSMVAGYNRPTGGIMSFINNTWTKYDTSNSMINDVNIGGLLFDTEGNLWFGNRRGQIGKFINTENCSYFDLTASRSEDPSIRHMINDRAGNCYIGTDLPDMGGYALYKTNLSIWTPIPYYKGSEYNLATDGTGTLYMKYDKIYKFINNDTVSIPGCPFLNTSNIYGRAPHIEVAQQGDIWMDYTDEILVLYDTTTGGYFFYTNNGIAHFNGTTWTKYNIYDSPLPSPYIEDIKIAPDGSIWISTGEGLAHLSNGSWSVFNTSNSALPFNYIGHFAIDQSGNLWFSDQHFGLYRFDGNEVSHFIHPTMSQYGGTGTPVIDIDGSIWQYFLLSVNRFDGSEFTHYFTEYNSPLGFGNIRALTIDKYGNKWIGTQEGFVIYREGGVITNDIEIPNPGNDFSLITYPNPFESQVIFDFGHEYSGLNITLYNVTGQKVYSNRFFNTDKVNLKTNLKQGTYIYNVETSEGTKFSGKITGGNK